MTRIINLAALVLIAFPSFAADKKETRSLPDDAADLAEKSGKNGWVSDEVTVSMDDSKKKARGKLLMRFTAPKGKPTGYLDLVIDDGKRAFGRDRRFELVEKDGKRYIKILDNDKGTDPKVLATVQYSLEPDELTIKGGVIRAVWAGWDVDLTKGVSFKAAGK